MTTFTIDSENNITAHAGLPVGADESQPFTNQRELAKLTADWPVSRLVETWNSFAGVAPFDDLKRVKKFTDRSVAVARIYKAVERLAATVAGQAADVAPVKGKAAKAPAKSKQPATKRTAANAGGTREGSKKAEVIALMKRKHGATLDEVIKLTGWQTHTVRGFVSGMLCKKLGLNVESFRTSEKGRCYRIAEGAK
jgi:hypothetical protein